MIDFNDEHDREEGGPARVIGALVAVGLFGGVRGRLVLTRLKRLAGIATLLFLAGIVSAVLVLPREISPLVLVISMAGSLASFLFWCYAGFAKWLTRDADAGRDLEE